MSKAVYLVVAGTLMVGCSSEAPQPTAPISVPVGKETLGRILACTSSIEPWVVRKRVKRSVIDS